LSFFPDSPQNFGKTYQISSEFYNHGYIPFKTFEIFWLKEVSAIVNILVYNDVFKYNFAIAATTTCPVTPIACIVP